MAFRKALGHIINKIGIVYPSAHYRSSILYLSDTNIFVFGKNLKEAYANQVLNDVSTYKYMVQNLLHIKFKFATKKFKR